MSNLTRIEIPPSSLKKILNKSLKALCYTACEELLEQSHDNIGKEEDRLLHPTRLGASQLLCDFPEDWKIC
jgi:hypothetical protein